jgi:hypothetical protein
MKEEERKTGGREWGVPGRCCGRGPGVLYGTGTEYGTGTDAGTAVLGDVRSDRLPFWLGYTDVHPHSGPVECATARAVLGGGVE